jgi:hypothetical protein
LQAFVPGKHFCFPTPAEKYCPREEKDIRRWKRDFPGKVLFHFSIPQRSLRDRKVEKYFPRDFSFPPSNILFFPGQYFSAGQGKQNCSPGQFSFHDTKVFYTILYKN